MTAVGYNIPPDLTVQILLRLPAKSIFRFRCVSKTWSSILRHRRFAESYMSLSKPRLVLAFNHTGDNRLLFFSAPDNQSSSIVAVKENTLTMPKIDICDHIVQSNSVRGFVCCSLKHGFVVCNPTTGQVINLPKRPGFGGECWDHKCYLYLGFDPSTDQYKVLLLEKQMCKPIKIFVCTLGGQESNYSWRPVESSILYYNCDYNGVCIDGIVYFDARLESGSRSMTVGCFDVGSEELNVVNTPEMFLGILTNYLGKLAVYTSSNDCHALWVLDDVENHVWSKKAFVFPAITRSLLSDLDLCFRGITAAGEIVYVPLWFDHTFEILFYHVEKKVERRVRVEGLVGYIYSGFRVAPVHTISYCYPSVSACYVDNISYL